MPPQQSPFTLSSGTFPIGQRTDVARVLVAEDDPNVLRLVVRLLRRAGIEVETAATPRDALELISALGFDLILTDLFAPEMSGARIVAAVRLFDPLLPIVIISGDTDSRRAVDAIQDPALYFVNKPFSNDALLDLVCGLVGVDRQGQLRPPARTAVGE
ncbi:MAG: response regulator [Pseudomonadota bacterium]